jgi:peptide chain release factor 3
LYQKPTKRGAKAEVLQVHLHDSADQLQQLLGDDELYDKLIEDSQLLQELLHPLDMDRIMNGDQSPLFFGSAMTNFGVQLFLDTFCRMGTRPLGRTAVQRVEDTMGESNIIDPENEEFTGFIFKTQANLDPKHRDRLAFVRIVSGTYVKGMKVGHSRSKVGKKYKYVFIVVLVCLKYPVLD